MLQIMKKYSDLAGGYLENHAHGAFPTEVLDKIERYLSPCSFSAETGCGKSTILFSNYSKDHLVFALDDTSGENSSVNFYRGCALSQLPKIREIFGPTQKTLPNFEFERKLDLVLIDGPHGHPFPELEYYFFYPHLREGALLILDDVAIPTIGRLADIICEDDMFDLIDIIADNTAVFRRTAAATFDPLGDGWWKQNYNRRRIHQSREFFLQSESNPTDVVSSQKLDIKRHTPLELNAAQPASEGPMRWVFARLFGK